MKLILTSYFFVVYPKFVYSGSEKKKDTNKKQNGALIEIKLNFIRVGKSR